MQIETLTNFEKETLLRAFLYRLNPVTRGELIAEYPVIYRKLLGYPVTRGFMSEVRELVVENREIAPSNGTDSRDGKTKLSREAIEAFSRQVALGRAVEEIEEDE